MMGVSWEAPCFDHWQAPVGRGSFSTAIFEASDFQLGTKTRFSVGALLPMPVHTKIVLKAGGLFTTSHFEGCEIMLNISGS